MSKWLSQYRYDGINGIIPKKSWPKSWETHNRAENWLESEIIRLAKENVFEWPIWISDEISDIYDININQSTVYRILKRTKTRYYYWYYWSRKKRKLYVKDIPWREFSKKMTDYLEKLWIDHNKNPAYTPQYNGKVERYHRTMKEKCCAYWKFKASLEELDYDLKLWIDFYNSKKRHY